MGDTDPKMGDGDSMVASKFSDLVTAASQTKRQEEGGGEKVKGTPKTKTKKKPEKKDNPEIQEFETKIIEAEAKWLCDLCDYTGTSNKSVKQHWTKKHRREVEEDEAKKRGEKMEPENEEKRQKEDDESDDEEFDEEDLCEGFDEDGNRIEKVEGDEQKKDESVMDAETNSSQEDEKDVQILKEDLATKTAEVESLKDAMIVRQDILNLAQGKIASLEIEKEELEKEVKKYKRIVKVFKEEEKGGKKNESKTDESKCKKELKEANIKIENLMKTVREETNQRAYLETQVKIQHEINMNIKDIMVMQGKGVTGQGMRNESRNSGRRSPGRGSPSRIDSRGEQLCRNHSKPGGCKRKDCVFFHPSGRSKSPPQPSRNDKPDCSYWLAGHCRKTEDKCYGKHEPSKCGTKAQKETNELLNPDFVNTLVRAVSQGLAGVQQQQTAQDPALGKQPEPQPQQQMMPMVQQVHHHPSLGQHGIVGQPPMVPMMMSGKQHVAQDPALGKQPQAQQQMLPMMQQAPHLPSLGQHGVIGQPQMMPMMMMPGNPHLFYPTMQGGQQRQ